MCGPRHKINNILQKTYTIPRCASLYTSLKTRNYYLYIIYGNEFFAILIYKIYSISEIIGFLISSNIIKGSHVRYWINETIIKECWLFPFFDSPPFPREIKLITILTAFRCAWLNIEPSAKQTWQIKCATFYNVID